MGNEQSPKRALYTKIDGTYYKINKKYKPTSMNLRTLVFDSTSYCPTHSAVHINGRNVIAKVFINTINPAFVMTNKDRYDHMMAAIREQSLTEIPLIENRFVAMIDYSVYTGNGEELFHHVNMQEIQSMNSLYNYFGSQDNDLHFKVVQGFSGKLNIEVVKSGYPFGIIQNPPKHSKFVFKINDISIYQDLILPSGYTDCHASSTEVSLSYQSHLLEEALSHKKCIYSSLKTDGIEFTPVEVDFIPHTLCVDYELFMDNCILVYNNATVEDLLIQNTLDEIVAADESNDDGD